jgi:hypothetical protein
MLGLRLSATALAASVALAGLVLSAPASAKSHHHHHRHHQVQVDLYGDAYSSYDEDYGNDTFPNTVDHSAECINGFRWQRHNHDWYKTEAQDSMPLRCH